MRDHFWGGVPAQSSRREASTWTFFDRLDIFSDAIDRKMTMALSIQPHTHFLGAGTNHTESATEILWELPRSLIAVSCLEVTLLCTAASAQFAVEIPLMMVPQAVRPAPAHPCEGDQMRLGCKRIHLVW